MPRVTVWKCPHTGKLFEEEKKYKTHLNRLARERREQRKIQISKDLAKAWWLQVQDTEMDISELPEFIMVNQSRFWAEAARTEPWDWNNIGRTRKGVAMPVPKLVWFNVFDLEWSGRVSNSHACPRGGVMNWGGREKLTDGSPAPHGYPGWTGRMEWRIEWPQEWDGWYPGSNLFKGQHVCIHSGSGGGGTWKMGYQTFGYDIKIFAADWPGMARWREKQQIWDILKTVA